MDYEEHMSHAQRLHFHQSVQTAIESLRANPDEIVIVQARDISKERFDFMRNAFESRLGTGYQVEMSKTIPDTIEIRLRPSSH